MATASDRLATRILIGMIVGVLVGVAVRIAIPMVPGLEEKALWVTAQVWIPPEGIALLLGVDRLLDMARTTLNVAADVVTVVIVDEPVAGSGSRRSGSVG